MLTSKGIFKRHCLELWLYGSVTWHFSLQRRSFIYEKKIKDFIGDIFLKNGHSFHPGLTLHCSWIAEVSSVKYLTSILKSSKAFLDALSIDQPVSTLYKERGGSCMRGLVVMKVRGGCGKLPRKAQKETKKKKKKKWARPCKQWLLLKREALKSKLDSVFTLKAFKQHLRLFSAPDWL